MRLTYNEMFSKYPKGSHAYYYTPSGDTIPCIVRGFTATKVRVDGDFLNGNRRRAVSPSRLELQTNA